MDRAPAVHPSSPEFHGTHAGRNASRLIVSNITKTFQGDAWPTLTGVSLEANAGDFVVLIGPSGCGKSTLLNTIAGLLAPDEGSVSVDGREEDRLGRVAYMHQRDLLMPWRTVVENARLGLEIRGTDRQAADRAVREAAGRFGLADVLDRRPWQLSGGMRQRVALLRATLPETGVLLLDEPFGALDAITRTQLQKWLAEVMEDSDQAVVLVTHDVEEALLLADRVHVMAANPGRISSTIDVDLPKPRFEAITSSSFTQLKARLLTVLGLGRTSP